MGQRRSKPIPLFVKKVEKYGKERKVIEYLNKSIAWDTETTSCYFEDKKVAWMYVWAVMDDEGFKHGRTWDEFKDWINDIKIRYNLNENRRCIVYCHNLPFDFSFIPWNIFSIKDVFATKEHKIVKCIIDDCIELRDSAILANAKLEKIAEEVGLKKMKGDLDYRLIRHYETEISEMEWSYIYEDVHILQQWIQKKIEEEDNNILNIPLTATSYVRRELLRTFREKQYYNDRKKVQNMTLREEEYVLCKKAFQGGFTHANAKWVGKVVNNVWSRDFCSSYPTVLCTEKYPMQKGFPVKINNLQEFLQWQKDFCIITEVEMTELELQDNFPDSPLSFSHCEQREECVLDNGRIYCAKRVVTWGTDIDIKLWIQAYHPETIAFRNTYVYRKDYLPKPVLMTIFKFYQMKTELKGQEEYEDEYRRFKAWLNAVYGMMVSDITHDEIMCMDSEWSTQECNNKEQIERYNTNKNRCLFYPWGLFCTSYARQNLWRMILELGNDYIYSDTDSCKYINEEKHREFFDNYNIEIENKLKVVCDKYNIPYEMYKPKDIKGKEHCLGVFDLEENMQRFKTLGAKRYIKECDGKVEITIAGLGKESGRDYICSIGDPFKVFDNNMVIPAKNTGKLTHTYLVDDREIMIEDYTGKTGIVQLFNGCHLEPTSFKMSLSQEYIDFIENIN